MTHEEMLDAAAAAVEEGGRAILLREELRWSVAPEDPERARRIRDQLEKLRLAMIPVRSASGSMIWDPGPEGVQQACKDASKFVQYQRRQLKKMLR